MKSPKVLRQKLRRQWQNGALRETSLLNPDHWPLTLPIGKPSPAQITEEIAAVREHIQSWRSVKEGEVTWQLVNFRSTAEPVELPVSWQLNCADEWVPAMADKGIQQEYLLLSNVIKQINPLFHPIIIRQRQQILSKGGDETIQTCEVALQLTPGYANGRPLRALSIAGCDSKFFERNRALLIKLLETRFDSQALELGLGSFLNAQDEGEHWLLVVPLETGLLPFNQQRVRSSELAKTSLPGSHLLIVENERSLYQLPKLPGTIAILGAGLNLSWLKAHWIREKKIAYWGDIDTWGLTMLATVRDLQPTITALLMTQEIFEEHKQHSVSEAVIANQSAPAKLAEHEQQLYLHLAALKRGRLEQEFITDERVKRTVIQWHGSNT
ncbi:MAG: DUF2220 family protein [Candidatus Polarisedimenticolaceae bacterium]|nr:DUF2220 family protein [Candidatus Polarisedimenticolaceae bacterium]